MNPQQQAQQLFDKFYIICQEYTEEIQCSLQAKECGMLHCDLMICFISQYLFIGDADDEKYWNEVKTEIEKL